MPKKLSMKTRELTAKEISQLQQDKVFSRFSPTRCDRCGTTERFTRRILQILGIPKDQWSDDAIQGDIRGILYQRLGIEYTFFRTHKKGLYVDSAVCPKCQSTAVVYDITFDDDVLAEFARRVGGDPKVIKAQLEEMAAKVEERGKR
jgi:hypothetical protein